MRNRNFLKSYMESNSPKYILASLLFAFGIFLGIALMLKNDLKSERELVEYFVEAASKAESGLIKNFKSSMLLNFKYLVILGVFSALPRISCFCTSICGMKGFSVGYSVTFLIKNYGGTGALYSLLAVMPSVALILPVYAFASVTCINLSADRRRLAKTYWAEMLPALILIYFLMIIGSFYDYAVVPAIFKRFF